MSRLRACWVSQAPVGGGDAEDVYSTGGVLDDEERIQAAQAMVSR